MKNMLIVMTGMMLATTVIAEEAKSDYPLKTCVVSGETLGEMGDPFVYKYKGHEVRFCCKSCVKDFQKNPEEFLETIEKAAAEAKSAETPATDESAGHHHADSPSK